MTLLLLFITGICLGSFINALVWRLRQQLDDEGEQKKLSTKQKRTLSITRGRSMCPHCKHELAAKDLVPVLSWLSVGGKCRYCKKPISRQYPLIELLTAALFVCSYIFWPLPLNQAWLWLEFATWLVVLVGVIALAIYDAKWYILPDRIIGPLVIIQTLSLAIQIYLGRPVTDLLQIAAAISIAAGVFAVIFAVSKGAWIGGGDVKLGIVAGLALGLPDLAILYLFLASVLGTLWVLPQMLSGKLGRSSKAPFGPFLVASLIVVTIWGSGFTEWYIQTFLGL